MTISDRNAATIKKIGTVLLVVGAVVLALAFRSFDRLPNYLRIASVVPLAFAKPMVTIDDYRAGWPALTPREKGQAIGWLIPPVLFPIGALVWFLMDPTAKG